MTEKLTAHEAVEAFALYGYHRHPEEWVDAALPGAQPSYREEKIALAARAGIGGFYVRLDSTNRKRLIDAALAAYSPDAMLKRRNEAMNRARS